MQLVAFDQGFDLETRVDPGSVDQLHIGQRTAIRFPAFIQRTTPQIFGTVETISATTVVDEKTGISFYRVIIAVPPEEMIKLKDVTLVPGMPAQGFIETKPRTVLSFIMKPIEDILSHTFREE